MSKPNPSIQQNKNLKAGEASSFTDKTKAIAEVAIVFATVLATLWGVSGIAGFEAWQRQVFQHPIITTLFCIVLIPYIALLIQPNTEKTVTILNPEKLKRALQISGKSFSVMMPATFFSFPVAGVLGYSFYGWSGGLIIAAVHLAAIPCLLLLFKNDGVIPEAGFSASDLLQIMTILIISGGLIFGLKFIHEKLSQIVVMLVFVGFAEEFMFRGYIQGRLNQAFGKPFRMMSFSFGWGLIIAALLFGSMHVLSPGNPLHLAWGLWTSIVGICFGIIREKGGSFLASALVHGVIMVFPVFFGM